jgi:hypothetical protein
LTWRAKSSNTNAVDLDSTLRVSDAKTIMSEQISAESCPGGNEGGAVVVA